MIVLHVSGFDWDSGNRTKCQKHGVSIPEIEEAFQGEPRVAPDPKHSDEEDRLVAIGRSSSGRPIFVVFTLRTKDGHRLIRPVSARYMHAREIDAYEKESSETEE